MRKSSLRLYAPFLALAIVQALFIAVAPSKAPARQELATGPGGFSSPGVSTGAGTGTFDPTAPQFDASGNPIPAGTGATGTDPNAGATAPGQQPTTPGAPPAGDTSHCAGDRQFDILINNPPCKAKFTGDNGGATYPGVTAETIKVVIFQSEPNAAVNVVLAPQGLAATEPELVAMYAALEKFVAAHYELYGRKLEIIRFTGNCPTSPPDVPACKEAAREVVKLQPFMVVFGTPLYAEIFDEWARAGIVSIGGWHFDDSYFSQRRPYRYDVFMDGTRSAEVIAEYYCKKMAGGNADHAGVVIHPTIGGRNTRRKLGITVPEIPANVLTATHVADLVEQCDGVRPIIVTYESDIERAAEQTTATTLKYINEKVTTVVCMCDPIAPAFGTKGFTQQGYFPEILMPGLGLIDYDLLGRLYDTQQMAHAFGPGHLQEPIAFDQQDASRVWRDVGNSGSPCKSCNLHTAYFLFVASILQAAGPTLNPLTLEQAVLTSVPVPSDKPGTVLIKFGPGDYTALSDAREVYWSQTTVSKIDGNPGAYVSPNNAERYELGQWPPGLDSIPVASS